MKSLVIAASMACAVLGAATSAGAAILTWTLQDVTFVDGGTASGSFVYDTASHATSDWDITTTAGTTLAGFHYQPSGGLVQIDVFSTNTLLFAASPSFSSYLYLHFAGPLTAAGGTVALLTVRSPQGSLEAGPPVGRAVQSGSVSAVVPEPGVWALMILGFGATGSALRRRARGASAVI